VRHSEFWVRMEHALGASYARSWASSFVMRELGGRTAAEAIDAGMSPKEVWEAVWRTLELPATEK
jgi:hypothetical protein